MADEIEGLQYVNFIRQQKCCVCYVDAPNDPDHLDAIGMGRDRHNPNLYEHYSCIPLCRKHHIERHTMSIADFDKKHHCNLWWETYNYFVMYLMALRKGEL